MSRWRSGRRHQVDEHPSEARQVYVELRVDRLQIKNRFHLFGPCQGISIAWAMTQVDVHIHDTLFGDERGIEPGTRGEFVIKVITFLGESGDIPGRRL